LPETTAGAASKGNDGLSALHRAAGDDVAPREELWVRLVCRLNLEVAEDCVEAFVGVGGPQRRVGKGVDADVGGVEAEL
jgi:hypothetical protein